MPFLKENKRKLRSADEIDKINGILERYVDLNNLYYNAEFQIKHVDFLERPDDDRLLLKFDETLEPGTIKIFTMVSNRYLEFDLENLGESGVREGNSYECRILKCSLALDKRKDERVHFQDHFPPIANVAVMKARETEREFGKSLSIKMIIDELADKIEGFDYVKVFYKGDPNLPPAVGFTVKSKKMLFIEDMQYWEEVFAENEGFFHEKKALELSDTLKNELKGFQGACKSLLVYPLEYSPVFGPPFFMAYLYIRTKERGIVDDDMKQLSEFSKDLSEKIRYGNTIEIKTGGRVIDVSGSGARIELMDRGAVQKILSRDIVMMDIAFIEKNPLRVAGRVVYIYQPLEGPYLVGVDFTGSHFGPSLKQVIVHHIRQFRHSNDH